MTNLIKFVRDNIKQFGRVCGVFMLSFAALPVSAGCQEQTVDLKWDNGQVRFAVELAQTRQERAKGLMFRETLGRYKGMLFVYDKPDFVAFWMKNTLIPLDMVFIGPKGVVQSIHANAIPGSLESIPGGDNVLAVLEINGGLSEKIGIPVGAYVRHPAFESFNPIWPCE